MMDIFKYFSFAVLILYSIFISGCSTPEGGSSLPWSSPEPWETQTLPSIEER